MAGLPPPHSGCRADIRLPPLPSAWQRPLSFREFKRLVAAAGTTEDGSVLSSGNEGSMTPSANGSGWSHGPGSAHGSSSSAEGGGDGDDNQLARTISEAMAMLPRSLEGMRDGIKGAAADLLSGPLSRLLPKDQDGAR